MKYRPGIRFTRVQKTASSSLRQLVRGLNNPRIHVFEHGYVYNPWESKEQENRYHNKDWEGFREPVDISKYYNPSDTIISINRNPFDIFVSYYLHSHKEGWGMVNKLHNINSFDAFVDYYLDPSKEWHLPPMKKSMFSFLYDENDKLITDIYYKLEEIEKINNLLNALGMPNLKHINKTLVKTKDFRSYYKPAQVEALSKVWKRDLDYFNYNF